ncbi:MAG: iron response transcriptional regulator IrrA [Rickettsiales bacterium]
MQLGALLWGRGHCHMTAEQLHQAAMDAGVKVSLATIYNTLHQFVSQGLLREVVVGRGCSYFDTNVEPHHHFLHTDTGELVDIPNTTVDVGSLPTPPEGMKVRDVDVIIRVEKAAGA